MWRQTDFTPLHKVARDIMNSELSLLIIISLLHRLPTENPGQKPILHEAQPDIHPLEILFDVSKLLDEENVTIRSFRSPLILYLFDRINHSALHLSRFFKLWDYLIIG